MIFGISPRPRTSVRAKFAPKYATSVDSFIFVDTLGTDTPQPGGGRLLLNPLTPVFLTI